MESVAQPAIILRHPRSPLPMLQDPREQAVIDPAIPPYTPPTAEEWELLAVANGLTSAIEKYGADRVMRWVRSLATILHQSVEMDRPLDRCLADGMVLPPSRICVRCGRDNS